MTSWCTPWCLILCTFLPLQVLISNPLRPSGSQIKPTSFPWKSCICTVKHTLVVMQRSFQSPKSKGMSDLRIWWVKSIWASPGLCWVWTELHLQGKICAMSTTNVTFNNNYWLGGVNLLFKKIFSIYFSAKLIYLSLPLPSLNIVFHQCYPLT